MTQYDDLPLVPEDDTEDGQLPQFGSWSDEYIEPDLDEYDLNIEYEDGPDSGAEVEGY